MQSVKLVGLFIVLFLVTPAAYAGSDAPPVRPAFHEEVSSIWDEINHQFQDLGSRFREHFGSSREAPGDRPLIAWMLSRRDELKLSSDQVRSLERLRNDFERESIKTEADLRMAEMDLAELLRA